MSQTLTTEYFDQVVQGLATKKDLERFATKEDVHRLEASIATKQDVDHLATHMHASFSGLLSSVDRYLKRTEGWYQEFSILKGKHDKLAHALIQKGVVNERDTSL